MFGPVSKDMLSLEESFYFFFFFLINVTILHNQAENVYDNTEETILNEKEEKKDETYQLTRR